jgi:enterochelin esterase-like enzyme
MKTRQAIILTTLFALLAGPSACSTFNPPPPTPTPIPATATLAPSPTAIVSPTPTPLGCLTRPGKIKEGRAETSNPAQEYLIYLPPCYDVMTDIHYPVLYLLHGQTYTEDQWVRLGAADAADELILSDEAKPFIIVFPDDRYWNQPAGPAFGDRLINFLIPHIDQNYRTLADRDHRALGGLSRGGGWTIQLGLQNWQMFGSLGLHSPVIFVDDGEFIPYWLREIPEESWPRMWIDIGDRDGELTVTRRFEALITEKGLPHEFHFYAGDHTENYWGAHTLEYIRWYAQGWQEQP